MKNEEVSEEGKPKRVDWVDEFFNERQKRLADVSAETRGEESVSKKDYPRLAVETVEVNKTDQPQEIHRAYAHGLSRASVESLLASAAKLAADEADRLLEVAGTAGGAANPQPGGVDRSGSVRLVLRGVAVLLGRLRQGR